MGPAQRRPARRVGWVPSIWSRVCPRHQPALVGCRESHSLRAPEPNLGIAAGRGDLRVQSGHPLFAKAEKMASLGVVDADELAQLAVYLASPAAAKLTGQCISMNGGISTA